MQRSTKGFEVLLEETAASLARTYERKGQKVNEVQCRALACEVLTMLAQEMKQNDWTFDDVVLLLDRRKPNAGGKKRHQGPVRQGGP